MSDSAIKHILESQCNNCPFHTDDTTLSYKEYKAWNENAKIAEKCIQDVINYNIGEAITHWKARNECNK